MVAVDSEKVKAVAVDAGVDLVGIASADCIETTPNRCGPRNVLPEAKSVVVFAKRMLVGSIECASDAVSTYQNLALYHELERTSYSLGVYLEKEGYRSATIPAYSPVEMTLETKGFVGVVSLRHVAQAAGLGKIGRSHLLVTPDLGPRIRLGAVVTTANLDPDSPLDQNSCEDCRLCVNACPVGSLSQPDRTHTGRCVRQILPYGLSNVIAYLTETLDQPTEKIKASFLKPDFWNLYQSLQMGMQYGCHACMNACPVGMKPQ